MLIALLLLKGSTLVGDGTSERVRRFTRPVEFEFAGWMADAAAVRVRTFSGGATGYLSDAERAAFVEETLSLLEQELRLEAELERLYGDPALELEAPQIGAIETQLDRIRTQLEADQPIAEAILAEQTTVAIDELGLTVAGVAAPPVGFRFTELPFALIVSPRSIVRQDASIQLETELELAARVELERTVEQALDVSALVVPIGGIGTYPTMIQESASLPWITEVIAHEWIHNFLAVTPLGLNYDSSAALRTMNETAASLMGREIGRLVLQRYYPDQLPQEPVGGEARPAEQQQEPAFDFREEMRRTRVQVDALLAEGRIEDAEQYMEARRREFWEQGFSIRRLNQAYFAFHGSYADEPGGAAGEDPIGEAVRKLWQQARSPARFLMQMAAMDSEADLFNAVGADPAAPIG